MRRAKDESENFSDAIGRLLGDDKHPLHGLVGLLEEDEADRLRGRSRACREGVNSRMWPTDRSKR
ncbi:antitoxin VapB family protein [Halapricum hydrolyticum]|uniref:Antitoxin VapB family protein n=1 Tax=Halapricum hydrolyticum TaxID=2979991 RepID=A0AAE3LH05_9EURY|nr:antitoxin VapB family protein [Halapricum hydrolyticum]MCU4718438.1 antitoxin VapB family protein [Halapricum hydrolyticum]MCU4726449.1 antitoxin VapB family protein [Halapricum hydrolyticum]